MYLHFQAVCHTASVPRVCVIMVRVLRGGAHNILRDVRHQQAYDDQHHAYGASHGGHGDHNVLHAGGQHGELHAVSLVPGGQGQGTETEAVGDVLVQVSQQKVSAAGAEVDGGAFELRVAPVPPAAQLHAGPPARPVAKSSPGCGS